MSLAGNGSQQDNAAPAPVGARPATDGGIEMNNIKFFLPPPVFETVCGVGLYLAQLAFHGDHKALAIAGSAVGIAAAVAFSWTAFKVGLLSRRPVTSIPVTKSTVKSAHGLVADPTDCICLRNSSQPVGFCIGVL